MASCAMVISPLTLTGALVNVRVASAVKVPEKENVWSDVARGSAALAFAGTAEAATMPSAARANAAAEKNLRNTMTPEPKPLLVLQQLILPYASL